MIDDFHGQDPQIVDETFRGGGKSTIGEEATCIQAQFESFKNCVIVGSTAPRAFERLEAIKHEIENNDHLIELFGEQVGSIWQASKAVLVSGVCLQALGVGQAVRGIKHHEFRPDYVWVDDIEDEESVKTPEASHDRLKWLFGTLLPVCAKGARVRVTGNRLSPDAVVTKLSEDPDWKPRRIPICHQNIHTGEEEATWPELYDMEWINKKRAEYNRLGLDQVWASEYMCEAISQAIKPFKVEDYRVVPRTRSFEQVYVMYDPAKTTKNLRHQAQTGKAVFSWMNNKLIVWDGFARAIMPSELIDDIFKMDKEYSPISIKVEADGLEEWLMEPLRSEQTRRRILLPHLGPERAPRDKDAFIRSLQPWFSTGQVEFAKDLPEFRTGLINYPSGKKDALNALAYALKMKPGQPVYEGFNDENIEQDLEATTKSKCYLSLNSDGNYCTGVLMQYDGALCVIADWIEAGDSGQCMEKICKQASLSAGLFEIIVHPKELDQYQNKGVCAALRRIPLTYRSGRPLESGRAEIRSLLGRRTARPLILVSSQATWTLRALSGGYFKTPLRHGKEHEGDAEPNVYRVLMESVETFAGMMHTEEVEQFSGHLRTSRDGRQYHALIGDRHERRPVEG